MEVILPLEFGDSNISLIQALRVLPHLSILEFRLPTIFVPTQQHIHDFQSLLANYLLGFNQIQVITLPIQLVNIHVLHALASLHQLEMMNIIPEDGNGGDAFAWILKDSGIQRSSIIFPVLRNANVDLANVPQENKFSTLSIIVNRLPGVLVA